MSDARPLVSMRCKLIQMATANPRDPRIMHMHMHMYMHPLQKNIETCVDDQVSGGIPSIRTWSCYGRDSQRLAGTT